MQRFYGEITGGWWRLDTRKLEAYADEMGRLAAEEDLRRFLLLDRIHPATSEQVKAYRQSYIEELQTAASRGSGDETAPTLKSMPVKDAAALSMLGGFGAVVSGPPVAHGIGTRKAGFKSGN